MQSLKDSLPNLSMENQSIYKWWEIHGKEWSCEFSQVCIEHREICHNWELRDEQSKLLADYLEATLLLVECMNRS